MFQGGGSPAPRKQTPPASTQSKNVDTDVEQGNLESEQPAGMQANQSGSSNGPTVESLRVGNAGTSQPAPEIGGHENGGVFQPRPQRVREDGSVEDNGSKNSRLQPGGVHWPKGMSHPDNRDAKRTKVDPLGFTPSFVPLCGAITGVPFHNGRAKLPIGLAAPTPFVQPMWPDPEMLRKLDEEGSLLHPRKPTLKEFEALHAKVLRLEATVEKLSLQLNSQLNSQLNKTGNSASQPAAAAEAAGATKKRRAAERVD